MTRGITAPLQRRIAWRGGPIEISLRHQCRGGPVRDPPDVSPEGILQRAHRVVLLIHGFNVDMCKAGASYDTFAAELAFRWRARSVWVYWPGDAHPDGESSVTDLTARAVSAFSYPYQLRHAEDAAQALADYIGEAVGARRRYLPTPLRLSVVAHSLGCRLTLHLINALGPLVKAGMVSIELVVLMAAAVPIYEVVNGPYNLARPKAKRMIIYYSARDEILRYVFPLGQRAASRDPTNLIFGRSALGLVGMKSRVAAGTEQIPLSHHHGGYWPDAEIALKVMQELDGARRPFTRRVLVAREIDAARRWTGRSVAGRKLRGMAADHGCGCS